MAIFEFILNKNLSHVRYVTEDFLKQLIWVITCKFILMLKLFCKICKNFFKQIYFKCSPANLYYRHFFINMVCNKVISRKALWNVHLHVQTKVNPVICTVCIERLSGKSNFNNHCMFKVHVRLLQKISHTFNFIHHVDVLRKTFSFTMFAVKI